MSTPPVARLDMIAHVYDLDMLLVQAAAAGKMDPYKVEWKSTTGGSRSFDKADDLLKFVVDSASTLNRQTTEAIQSLSPGLIDRLEEHFEEFEQTNRKRFKDRVMPIVAAKVMELFADKSRSPQSLADRYNALTAATYNLCEAHDFKFVIACLHHMKIAKREFSNLFEFFKGQAELFSALDSLSKKGITLDQQTPLGQNWSQTSLEELLSGKVFSGPELGMAIALLIQGGVLKLSGHRVYQRLKPKEKNALGQIVALLSDSNRWTQDYGSAQETLGALTKIGQETPRLAKSAEQAAFLLRVIALYQNNQQLLGHKLLGGPHNLVFSRNLMRAFVPSYDAMEHAYCTYRPEALERLQQCAIEGRTFSEYVALCRKPLECEKGFQKAYQEFQNEFDKTRRFYMKGMAKLGIPFECHHDSPSLLSVEEFCFHLPSWDRDSVPLAYDLDSVQAPHAPSPLGEPRLLFHYIAPKSDRSSFVAALTSLPYAVRRTLNGPGGRIASFAKGFGATVAEEDLLLSAAPHPAGVILYMTSGDPFGLGNQSYIFLHAAPQKEADAGRRAARALLKEAQSRFKNRAFTAFRFWEAERL